MKIYTKTGDDGTTGLLGGARVAKTSLLIHAIGEVDELNACIGLALTSSEASELADMLRHIQHWLFDLGAELAAAGDSRWQLFTHAPKAIATLEESMDEQTAALPALKNFILPGGTRFAAELHHARCVCRRAERVVLAAQDQHLINQEVLVFLNRLSDWLFLAARTANAEKGVSDMAWQKSEE